MGNLCFDPSTTPAGTWLPGECLFSLASRYHRMAGNFKSKTTCLALFGHSRIGAAHDLPGRIDEFVSRTQGQLGSAHAIIYGHTVLPYFLAFRDSATAADAEFAMRGGSIGSLKFRLGLLTSRFRSHIPLKGCCMCMEADLHVHHVAYWHLDHQFPGVWVCPVHGCALREYTMKVSGEQRFDWFLPDDVRALTHEAEPERSPELVGKLTRLANAAISLGHLGRGFHFDRARLAISHRVQLHAAGLLGDGGRLRLGAIADHYLQFIDGLQAVRELSALPRDRCTAGAQVTRLLYRPDSTTHPLRELLLVLWLHGSWDSFMSHYANATPAKEVDVHTSDATLAPSASDPRRAWAVAQVTEAGDSATGVARRLAVDVSTVMAWLATAGVAPTRRAKKLKTPLRDRLLTMLRGGSDKAVVASELAISITTVTRYLRTEPSLRAAWTDSRREALRNEHRTAWAKLLSGNPQTGTPTLRSINARSYAWLYRNDRSWLSSAIASRELPIPGGARLNWDARDGQLALAVRATAAEQARLTGKARCTIAWLCSSIPDLRPKLGTLDQLPLTMRAIQEVAWVRKGGNNKASLL